MVEMGVHCTTRTKYPVKASSNDLKQAESTQDMAACLRAQTDEMRGLPPPDPNLHSPAHKAR